jgi:hypothetical protein
MGVPNQFNDIIQEHLNVFAAWVPIVNKYTLGDYGIFADGVFSKLGNITDDFQVTFNESSGAEASIDFTSEGATVVKVDANAGVSVAPAGDVKASVQIEFSKEKSFLVKSPAITVATIDNVNEVAKKLKATDKWDGQWKVVYQVYNAIDAVIVSTISAGTKLNFTGDATALGQMKLGSAGVNIDTNKTLGLKINGKNGVIGLGIFRLKSKLFGGWKVDIMAFDEYNDEDQDSPIFLTPADIKKDDV